MTLYKSKQAIIFHIETTKLLKLFTVKRKLASRTKSGSDYSFRNDLFFVKKRCISRFCSLVVKKSVSKSSHLISELENVSVGALKNKALLYRLVRNSFFYTYGNFFDSGRMFFRGSRLPSWNNSYISALNFVKFLSFKRKIRYAVNLRNRAVFRSYNINRYKVLGFVRSKVISATSSRLSKSIRRLIFLSSEFKYKKLTKPLVMSDSLHSSDANCDLGLFSLPFNFEGKGINDDELTILLPTDLRSLFDDTNKFRKSILLDSSLELGPNRHEFQARDIVKYIMGTKYGLELVKNDLDLFSSSLSNVMLNSSLKRQGAFKRRYFPDINKTVRPSVPNNNIYIYYRSFLLVLKFFPVLVITFRSNNLFFVLSSPQGNVIFSYSVGIGGEFKKSLRRSVFAYDSASREFAKKVKTITSVVGLRVQGQSKRRFYVLRNLKRAGIRFVFLQDIIPFACNGVKKTRSARKRRRR